MKSSSVRVGEVYRWGAGYWRVTARPRPGEVEIVEVRLEAGGDGSARWAPTGAREVRPGRELRPL